MICSLLGEAEGHRIESWAWWITQHGHARPGMEQMMCLAGEGKFKIQEYV